MADLSVESRHQLSTALDTDFEAFGYSRFLRPANVTRIGSAPSRGPQRSGPTRSGVGPDATFTDAEVIELDPEEKVRLDPFEVADLSRRMERRVMERLIADRPEDGAPGAAHGALVAPVM